jgi:DNA helicase-2/ATP-dependent DNA helicase PcrA
MEELKKRKEEFVKCKSKYIKKLNLIENEISKIEKEISELNNFDILENLTLSEQQKKVVEAIEKNILCIASAGSGKTHTIISRYINLILLKNVEPENVILISFTKKAGKEMLERLENLIPNKLPCYVGSLHGLCYKILQNYLNVTFNILEESDAKELLENEANYYSTDEYIQENIYRIINQATLDYPVNFKKILKKENQLDKHDIVLQIYKAYEKKKQNENIIDFNNLMVKFCDFMKSSKANEFKDKIKYIFFDEYQDINPIQNMILNFFKNSSIMVVGDDDQSIYSFRGSNIQYIWNFSKNFFDTKIYLLEENYRSTPEIVYFCQNIISKNINQYKKNIIPFNKTRGNKPNIYGFIDKNQQYNFVIQDIINKKKNNVAILARTNYSLKQLELLLSVAKISYVKQSGNTFLDKTHIKDFLAFVIILNNNKSSIHFKRIICLHNKLDMDKATKLINKSKNIMETIKEAPELTSLFNVISQLNFISKDSDKYKKIIFYLNELWKNKNYNIKIVNQDINNLLSFIKNSNLKDCINDLYLNEDIHNLDSNDNVVLSTVHSSKGLEWDDVYIVDMDNNEFPSIKSVYYEDEIDEMDEERRLFYVACSRAKKDLTITFSGDLSVFIRELDDKYYCGHNINKKNFSLCSDNMKIFLKNVGFSNISYLLSNLKNQEKIVHDELEVSSYISNLKNKIIIANFMNLLIHNNQVSLEDIFVEACKNIKSLEIDAYKKFLLSNENFYKDIDTFIKKLNIHKKIINNNELEMFSKDTIIKINLEPCSIVYLSNILYKHQVNKIILYNPIQGKINTFDTSSFDFTKFKKHLFIKT